MTNLNTDLQESEIQPTKKIPLLTKFTCGLFGVFMTSIIFAFSIKSFEEIGIWIGLIIASILVTLGLYYSKKSSRRSRLRIISWSMLITLLACTLLYFIGLYVISSSLKDL
ncbi:MAG: hypothetical protein AAB373_01945 [Patescibacteria group bacterium]